LTRGDWKLNQPLKKCLSFSAFLLFSSWFSSGECQRRERCLQAGMDAYITKPIRAQQLFEAIAAAIGRAQA
jgi:FixJ family two-component response regulator